MAAPMKSWRTAIVPVMIVWLVVSSPFRILERVVTGAESDGNVLAEFAFDGYAGILAVPLTLNGANYNFWIDTGCARTNFVPQLSSLLAETSRSIRFNDTAGAVTLPVYCSPEASIRGLKLPHLDSVSCTDEYLNRLLPFTIHGRLGMDALRTLILRVDYDRGKFSFLRSVPSDAGARVQLDESLICPTLKGSLGGLMRAFILDTGCLLYGAGCIRKRDFDELIARGELMVGEKVPSWSAFKIAEDRAGVVNGPVSIAGHHHAGLAFVEINNEQFTRNILGAGFLRRYVITFDFPHHAVYLSPGKNFRQIDASHDPGGLRLRREGDHILASALGWRSFASTAGVSMNDVLMEINGESANRLDDVALARLLSRSDRATSLVFRRSADGRLTRFIHDERAFRQRAANPTKE